MVTTVTQESLWRFITQIVRKLETQPAVTVDFLDENDLYINSKEYLEWRLDKLYDVNDPIQKQAFFDDLDAWVE